MSHKNSNLGDGISSEQSSCPNVISLEAARHRKKAHCVICGQTNSLQRFKGKWICSACLHSIPSLFGLRRTGSHNYNLSH